LVQKVFSNRGFFYSDGTLKRSFVSRFDPLIKLNNSFLTQGKSIKLADIEESYQFRPLFDELSEILSLQLLSVSFDHNFELIPWRSFVMVTDSRANNQNSFYQQHWHYDTVPPYCITCFVYLNNTDDGGTELISFNQSKRISTLTDYISLPYYGSAKDISVFGLDLEKFTAKPRVGNSLFFQPSRSLHRALELSTGIRFLLNIGFALKPVSRHICPSRLISPRSLFSSFTLGIPEVQAAPYYNLDHT
jgi:hypothetical protein